MKVGFYFWFIGILILFFLSKREIIEYFIFIFVKGLIWVLIWFLGILMEVFWFRVLSICRNIVEASMNWRLVVVRRRMSVFISLLSRIYSENVKKRFFLKWNVSNIYFLEVFIYLNWYKEVGFFCSGYNDCWDIMCSLYI